ncbi:hypothetical protein ACFLTP_05915 [Chloroflexota bacterium]
MDIKFKVGDEVRGIANTNDAGKVGTIMEKGGWINHSTKDAKPPVGIWFVLWDGETNRQLKREDDLEILEEGRLIL